MMRHLNSISSTWKAGLGTKAKKNKRHCFNSLEEAVVIPEELTVWIHPLKADQLKRSTGLIRRPKPECKVLRDQLDSSLIKECNSLEHHAMTKKLQLDVENDTMRRTGKSRELLLLRRHQVLPKISPNSIEKNVIAEERYETPDVFPDWALFAPVIYDIKERNGITCQMTKRQQGYTAVTDWLGCPEVTDEIRGRLDLNGEHVSAGLKQNDDELVCTQRQCNGACLPQFPRLAVYGINYKDLQTRLKLPRKVNITVKKDVKSDWKIDNTTPETLDQMSPASRTAPSRISLYLAHSHLSWSTDPDRSKQTTVVELGCTAELGKHSLSWIEMKNTGTVVIKYSWVKRNRTDELEGVPRDEMRLIFDSWDGIILPGEVYRVPFMYKAISRGQYSEDWQLLTQPVLENGGSVILRLWGFTRQRDDYLLEREGNEELLHNRMKMSIVKHRVGKIIDHLPLEDTALAENQFSLVLKGSDLFIHNNPWLYYNSTQVYRLGRIWKLVQKELKTQRRPSFSVSCEMYRSVSVESNDKYPIYTTQSQEMASIQTEEVSSQGSDDFSESVSQIIVNYENEIDRDFRSVLQERQKVVDKVIEISTPTKRKKNRDSQDTITSNYDDAIEKDESCLALAETRLSKQKQTHQPLSEINFINANVSVEAMRANILRCNANYKKQEALFAMMSSEVSVLLFKPFVPFDNWKIPMVKTLFAQAMESFSLYASSLLDVCCQAESTEQRIRKWLLSEKRESMRSNSGSEVTMNSSKPRQAESKLKQAESKLKQTESKLKQVESKPRPILQSQSAIDHDVKQESMDDDVERVVTPEESDKSVLCDPRKDLDECRYEDQYYNRLYHRMYWLLCDVIDQMDEIAHKNIVLNPAFGKQVFIKMDHIPHKVDVKRELSKPPPPKWIKVYKRMEAVRLAELRRKRELDEI